MQLIRSLERRTDAYDLGVAIRPCVGETVSGDRVWYDESGDTLAVVLVDALGHGREAHSAAIEIENALRATPSFTSVEAAIELMHSAALRGRGAAASVIRLELSSGSLEAASIGNTTIRIVRGDGSSDTPAADGVLGQSFRTPIPHHTRLVDGDIVLMFSDGVESRLADELYARLPRLKAMSAARLIIRQHGKTIDDASIAFLKVLGL
jgi:serine phosphatase RsbU (regulator of sigma subunit)